jgi:hypothetical protein
MRRPFLPALVILWFAALAVSAAPDQQPASAPRPAVQQSPETNVVRRAQMAGHYRAVTAVYEGVIRGDLAAVHEAAFSIWGLAAPSGMPAVGDQIAQFVQLQGRRAAQAPSLAQAAENAAGMLTLCGDCHAAVKVRVSTPDRPRPDVGGLVGHMLAHQDAVDALVEGLVAPSPSRWRVGAERLITAPLAGGDLPPDPALTAAIRKSEIDVHAIGKEALAAADNTGRTAVFAKLISTCANCHRLHGRVWGPRTGTR